MAIEEASIHITSISTCSDRGVSGGRLQSTKAMAVLRHEFLQ